MNQASDAVRYADPALFTDTKGVASKVAKRALLRHLADLCNWSCEVMANFHRTRKPTCDHTACTWLTFQSEPNTASELSMDQGTVKRIRRALVADGLISLSYEGAGRGAITFYTLNKDRLQGAKLAKFEKHKPSLSGPRRAIQTPSAKGGSLPPIDKPIDAKEDDGKIEGTLPPIVLPVTTEGGQAAHGRGASCTEKGGKLPFLYKKNPLEPSIEPLSTAITIAYTDAEVERIYLAYPRKIGKADALKAIREALIALGTGVDMPAMFGGEALTFLHRQVSKFAASHAGQEGKYTPHPATWFNKARYLDDEKEWNNEPNRHNDGGAGRNTRISRTLEALRRANEADASSQMVGGSGYSETGRDGGGRTPVVLQGS